MCCHRVLTLNGTLCIRNLCNKRKPSHESRNRKLVAKKPSDKTKKAHLMDYLITVQELQNDTKS